MRSAATFFVTIIVGILTIVMVITMTGRMNRSTEIRSNTDSAAEDTVSVAKVTEKYTVSNNHEMLSDFAESMSMAMDSNGALEMKVMGVNFDKGLLSVNMNEKFTNPNGNAGLIKDSGRTVILNKLTEDQVETFTITFYNNEGDTEIYKKYILNEGDTIPLPAEPSQDGKTFTGWVCLTGSLSDPVSSDMECYGQWN